MNQQTYAYHTLKNLTKEELFFWIVVDETAKHFGVEDISAIIAILAGMPILSTRQKPAGAIRGTSLASKYAAKLLPFQSPVRLPTLIGHTPFQLKVAMTANIGRFVGRAVPVVGWVILTTDISIIMYRSVMNYNHVVNSEDRIH